MRFCRASDLTFTLSLSVGAAMGSAIGPMAEWLAISVAVGLVLRAVLGCGSAGRRCRSPGTYPDADS